MHEPSRHEAAVVDRALKSDDARQSGAANGRRFLGMVCGLLSVSLLMLTPGPAAAVAPNTLTPAEIAEGWILLFDGHSTFGWTAASEANWTVVDGVLTASEGDVGLLHTTSQWGDFHLKVDFRGTRGGNSGVFLRTSPRPAQVNGRCYELNIADRGSDWPTGSLVQRKRADVPCDISQWHTFDATAERGRFVVKLDAQQVLDYSDPAPLGRGFIGLQLRHGPIEFRNVKLKPLATKSLWNGRNLTGWRTLPGLASVFSVTREGWLNVKDGRGALETVGTYADFTLQADVFVNGKGLNSGLFFRCIPGEVMNGYESQIHNGSVDGDRSKPQAAGTGGIFRRQDARRVVADDFTWFTKTIHVDGRHMAVWVNGYPVTDWVDTREPNSNPRKGLRLKAGTIQIQGHDPTTDLSLRKIRLAELRER